ncbi:manganese efflux pump [Bacillus aquiflavi]|uniref:Manganese efflux pump n=1 Tax=Bacillus aquiflavi TaxID=2672567 RepID=A0A6B3W2I3_9BACI|nr:manganese efflux pump [Bacillus aquiflavi]MBA4537850.1 manganese efflux pump [Bacillus aquiflavi]NEY82106.1 sporulation membrane protein YtaF [Bacillus aquiflavi]UAC48446.1 manganese efflux pump [Bacillus aquiflavi]
MMIVIIGIASNLDNAGIGIAYGVQNICISPLSNIIIALFNGGATLISGLFGLWLSQWFSPLMGSLIGTVILVAIGVTMLYQARKTNRIINNEMIKLKSKRRKIGLVETFALALALSVTNIVAGLDAGLIHLPIWITSLVAGFFSYINIAVSSSLSAKFATHRLGEHTAVIAGVMLILIGLLQLIL